MDSEKRRESIKKILVEKEIPIKGTELAKTFNVSRQVIVQDIAILRAKGEEILATPQGYMILTKKQDYRIVKAVVCKHTGYDEIDDELKTIIDMGGKVLDVIVEHPIYGEIKNSLMLSSRVEVDEFVKSLVEEKAEPLSSLTEGVHIHNIDVPSDEIYEKILEQLGRKGYLINEK
ncbi:transcription repressor NadR [Brassicibacter mesophilus]|uniref:transcription repressor NadR n=1 Tax=Brassicibacter mesophilus TaxID=745119 RepID=UPI003D21AED7